MTPEKVFNSGTAVITGSGAGIGEAMAKQLAILGMNVVVAELNEEAGSRVVDEIKKTGGNAIFVQTNVADAVSVKHLADIAYETFGSVELLVNNAGIGIVGSIWEISTDNWQRGIGVNVLGPIFGMQTFVPRMLKSDKPCYVANVASLASLSTLGNNGPYVSSKHALLSLTESLYVEMQNEENPVGVSVILPGVVKTDIVKNMTISNDSYGDTLTMMGGMIEDNGMSSEEAATIFIKGIAAGDFWITSHPEVTHASANTRAKFLTSQSNPKEEAGEEVFAD